MQTLRSPSSQAKPFWNKRCRGGRTARVKLRPGRHTPGSQRSLEEIAPDRRSGFGRSKRAVAVSVAMEFSSNAARPVRALIPAVRERGLAAAARTRPAACSDQPLSRRCPSVQARGSTSCSTQLGAHGPGPAQGQRQSFSRRRLANSKTRAVQDPLTKPAATGEWPA